MNSWTDGTMEAEAGAGAEAEGAWKVFIFAQRQGEVQKAKRRKQKEKGEKLGAKPCVKYIIWHWQSTLAKLCFSNYQLEMLPDKRRRLTSASMHNDFVMIQCGSCRRSFSALQFAAHDKVECLERNLPARISSASDSPNTASISDSGDTVSPIGDSGKNNSFHCFVLLCSSFSIYS